MKTLLVLAVALILTACGTINGVTSAALTSGAADYAATKKNVEAIHDAEFKAWADSACALNLGALARNSTGNSAAVNAALMACPVPNVGVINISPTGGGLSVQITNIKTQ